MAQPASHLVRPGRQLLPRGKVRKSWNACFSSEAPSGWNSARCPVVRFETWTAAGSGTTSSRFESRKRPHPHPSEGWRRKAEAWAKDQDEQNWKALAEDKEREWCEAREHEWTQLLVNTEFLDENDPQSATVAGLVLVGTNPNRFLPQAGSTRWPVSGREKDYDARERRKLRGPLVRLQGADGAVLEPGLPEQAVEFIRRNIDTVTLEDGIRRRERWDYPVEVVREVIVNRARSSRLPAVGFVISSSASIRIVWKSYRPADWRTASRPNGCASDAGVLVNELLKDVMLGLRLHGAHGHGRAPDDHPGNAGAQRHRAGPRRRWRAVHRPAVERAAFVKHLLARPFSWPRPRRWPPPLLRMRPVLADAARA